MIKITTQTYIESIKAQIDELQTELVRLNLSKSKRAEYAAECDRLNDILIDLGSK